ncbi:hypothetical protein [Falsiroseomonas sp. CW058]|uniref:hypothetical protein n=1 Tax=Falsiroseomonas sp. CW058 TaxID=3388664 RepID=UPI003D31B6EE
MLRRILAGFVGTVVVTPAFGMEVFLRCEYALPWNEGRKSSIDFRLDPDRRTAQHLEGGRLVNVEVSNTQISFTTQPGQVTIIKQRWSTDQRCELAINTENPWLASPNHPRQSFYRWCDGVGSRQSAPGRVKHEINRVTGEYRQITERAYVVQHPDGRQEPGSYMKFDSVEIVGECRLLQPRF